MTKHSWITAREDMSPNRSFLIPRLFCSLRTDLTLNNTPTQIYFSPHGGCTGPIIKQINQAESEIFIQAYSFISAPKQ